MGGIHVAEALQIPYYRAFTVGHFDDFGYHVIDLLRCPGPGLERIL